MAEQQKLKRLTEGLLRSADRNHIHGKLLELHHPGAPHFDPWFLRSDSRDWGLTISLCGKGENDGDQPVRCSSSSLPFQNGAFSMVVVHHLVSDGREPELSEAVRVLAQDGVLVLLGLNRYGWRYHRQQARHLPGMRPMRVKRALTDQGMRMNGIAGAGLVNQEKPRFLLHGFSAMLVSFADVLLLQACHEDASQVTPLRLRKPASSVVQSAAVRG